MLSSIMEQGSWGMFSAGTCRLKWANVCFFSGTAKTPLEYRGENSCFFCLFHGYCVHLRQIYLYGKCTFPSHSSLLSVPYLYASFHGIRKCGNILRWLPVAGSTGPAPEVVGTNDEQEGIFFMKKKEFPKMSNRL